MITRVQLINGHKLQIAWSYRFFKYINYLGIKSFYITVLYLDGNDVYNKTTVHYKTRI